MLSRILVPVRGDGMGEVVLSHAAALAHRHSAHIVVAHCRPQPEEMLPTAKRFLLSPGEPCSSRLLSCQIGKKKVYGNGCMRSQWI